MKRKLRVGMKKPDARRVGLYFALAQVGLEMVVPIVAGILLDHWLATGPWLLVAGAVLGLAGGLYHLVRLTQQLDETPGEDPK